MGKISSKKFQSSGASQREIASSATAKDWFGRNKILYLSTYIAAVLAWIVCLAGVSAAQRGAHPEDRAEITPQEKVLNKKKKSGEPRAVGLLQITDKGKATLVPIAILINGRFYDAASYKAAPVPMALESGTVYEGERTGSSLGLFTVNEAMHSRDPNSSTPWIGTGQWLLQGADAQKTTRKAEDVPVGLSTTDEPPRLTKSGKSSKDASPEPMPPTPGSPTGAGSNSPSTKPAEASPSSPPSSSPQSSSPQKTPDQIPTGQSNPSQTAPTQTAPTAKPDSSKPETPKSDQAAPAAGEDTNSQAGDANRPKLRRGKPTEPLPADQDVPGYSKPGETKAGDTKPGEAKPTTPAAAAETKPSEPPAKADQTTAAKTPPQLVPAISDEAGPDPRSFVYEWAKTEADDRRKEVLVLAQQQLHTYLQERAKNSISAKATSAKAVPAARKPQPKMPDLVLEDLQIRTFDLWANSQPVIVLSARAHASLPAVGSAVAANPVPEYSITLVARTDIYNNLHKLYVGVTDKYHLDVTPRLELIDAVDADGDGRGELLFHETSDAGSGYIIYRATADTLWKMFDSLNP